jgi:hypothetical protein
MHIPSGESSKIEILTFEQAQQRTADSADYDRERWIYLPDFYSEYRYVLGTVGSKPLITMGINPSTAAPDHLDNTLKSVERIALGNGFDSFLMFNVYAQRATRPDDMDRVCNERLHEENKKAFRWALERCGAQPTVWAAWGAIVEKRDYLKPCLTDLIAIGDEYNARWCRTGALSKKGHPHHPLYLKKDSVLCDFDPKEYIRRL